MRKFFLDLHQRNTPLSVMGWSFAILFVAAGIISLFDARTVLGINTWIKPMKFMASVTLFVWTIGWFLHYIRKRRWAWHVVTWGTLISMTLEVFLIIMQGARGVRSHFNFSTEFDAGVFGLMGILIGISTAFSTLLFLLFLISDFDLAPSYLWGIRFGFIVFLLGSAVGGDMLVYTGHAIGAVDGGPGLPFVNWSTTVGDLRIAHLAGLHALQILPFIGFLISRSRFPGSRFPRFTMFLVFVVYSLITIELYRMALRAVPLIGG